MARRLISTLLSTGVSNYSVRIIYCWQDGGYRFAVADEDGHLAPARAQDVPVLFARQDVLLVAEPPNRLSARQQAELDALVRTGTRVVFWLPHDELATTLLAASQTGCPTDDDGLRAIFVYADHILCPSSAIAAKLRSSKDQWVKKIALNMALQIDSLEADGMPAAAGDGIQWLLARLTLAVPKT